MFNSNQLTAFNSEECPELSKMESKTSVKKKKLLIVTTVSSTFENNLVSQPRFLSNEYNVKICSSVSSGLSLFAKREGVGFYTVEMFRGISLVKDIKSIIRFYQVLLKFQPDIVHSYTPKAGLVNAVSGLLRRNQISIHTFTGLVFLGEQGFKRKLLILVDKLIAKLVTEVIPEGVGVKKDLIKYKISTNTVSVIWHGNINGVDLERFTPVNTERFHLTRKEMFPGISASDKVFSFVGRINRHKGFEELMDAFCALHQKHSDCFLVVAGKIEDKNPVNAGAIARMHTHPNICYMGFIREIERVFSVADVNILPSYREGVPNAVLQSSAMAVPSIVSDIHGCNDIVEDGVNGWTIEVKSARALEDKMLEIIAMDKRETNKIGRRACQVVHQKFNRKDVQAKLSEKYSQLLNKYQGF